ncbi:unnamed protein product [Urochloa decumbens]|uniref:F-box domain-containing protein n=1 Tax=Urochloa decumbens TaxID=240449 RepID=A0ABC9BUB8_9POAL
MSGKDAAARYAPALPEDIIADILSRVPPDVAFLFRCALVCKRWRRVLADPVFLRRLLPEAGRSSSLLGFLVQRHRPSVSAWRTVANIFKSHVPAFVPAPGSALGPRRRSLTSFVRDGAGLLDNAEPLMARDDLILLRVSPSQAAAVGKLFSLCVCSLLTGKLDVLPPLDAACFDDEGVRGYAILRSVNQGDVPHRPAHGYSNLCQVLLIGVHRSNRQLHIHSFSTDAAALQSWGVTPANCLPGDPVLFSGPYGRAATVCHDTAHWLFGEHGSTGPTIYTIDVSVNSGSVCASKIIIVRPSPISFVDWPDARLSLTTDERLSILYEQMTHLIIRTRQDVDQSGTAPWTCTQGILVDVKELWSLRRLRLARVCVGEKSGIVLVLSGSGPNHTYLLDLQSKTTTKVAGWNGSFNYKTAVPYEINWPELFMSHLGVQL